MFIFIFRTEYFSCFYIIALKKNVLLRDKTKDAKLRLLFPHISKSKSIEYLTAISTGLSGTSVSVVLVNS